MNAGSRRTIRALAIHGAVFVGLFSVLVGIWSVTAHESFWPQHALRPLALGILADAWLVLLGTRPGRTPGSGDAFEVRFGLAGGLWLYLLVVGAMAPSHLWPWWPLLGLAGAAVLHTAADRTEPAAHAVTRDALPGRVIRTDEHGDLDLLPPKRRADRDVPVRS